MREAININANHISLPAIENAVRVLCSALDERYSNTLKWESMTEDKLWRELVSCILGSRVRYEVAFAAITHLEEVGLLCQNRRAAHFNQYEKDVLKVLSGALSSCNCYPFYRIRSKYIRLAAEQLFSNHGTIRQFLRDSRNVRDARRRLVSEVPGIGPKQASLFLRNIGYTESIAVLDVHVLSYMNWIGLTDTLLNSVSTMRKYETLEMSFIKHSYSVGYTPDLFDLAVWIVVKVAKEEYKSWG